MPFPFVCPYCHNKTLVDDQYAGKSGRCVNCGKPILVPAIPGRFDGQTIPSSARIRTALPWARWLQWLAAVTVFSITSGIGFYYMIPTIRSGLESRHRNLCIQNMRQIVLALEVYSQIHGSYPPPYVSDDQGTPLYSWRVLILPQLGYKNLYDQFEKDQPWNSNSNISLVTRMPPIFKCPSDIEQVGNCSNYDLIVGPGTLFPPEGAMRSTSVRDGVDQTLLLVETTFPAIWTDPSVTLTTTTGVSLGKKSKQIGSYHGDSAIGLTIDGTPLQLPFNLSPAILDALISPNGGESIDASGLKILK